MAADDITMLAKLRGLLEVTRLVRSEGDLTTLLGAIARTIRVSLGFQVVVMNVYRPEWDDFFVAVVEGGEDVRDALLGATYGWDTWRRVLDQRYERRGAYHVREGEFDWSEHGARFVPDREFTSDPDVWHAEDELFVPFRHSDGHLLGIVSVGEPESGLRPDRRRDRRPGRRDGPRRARHGVGAGGRGRWRGTAARSSSCWTSRRSSRTSSRRRRSWTRSARRSATRSVSTASRSSWPTTTPGSSSFARRRAGRPIIPR